MPKFTITLLIDRGRKKMKKKLVTLSGIFSKLSYHFIKLFSLILNLTIIYEKCVLKSQTHFVLFTLKIVNIITINVKENIISHRH